ncbi:type IV toxin-antitoxin system YeeU family antitoxin [Enterobacter sp. A11]|uniref:type IV toxin-antitoxin system YeeU family antitoxin n=1 Tax=unclassified Enterobacter TaxID=2608935 RepID=UPI0010701DF6|nr:MULTISPECIES: type IV toxin-antitoxin system YeeU family antitoxin [unclassified Enterobacter]MBM1020255.1 type IV toxin-antitoxin system YeeU family antitoxin [Enterobacter sp. E1]MEA3561556.1 type IV toxin-antitoxin system YeeU family antitoxin [Enterobacter sp. GM-22]MEA3595148.1 type IV toxin-antitoxin system YeeU family antitoxin [Enterobacter sp. GM-31]TFF60289.1 type IV toxin-antitoxin system YeeU family antitoxin [Enterobacter sp. A11]
MSQHTTAPVWGLRSDITPSFGARLVQEGNQLHYLADRAGLNGEFTPEQLQALETTFPLFVKQMEAALKSCQLDPRRAKRHRCTLNGLTCESDTNGSFGYVYTTIYPTDTAQ